MRTQKLSAVDELVRALLVQGIPLILGWDAELSIYLIADLEEAANMPAEDAPFDEEDWIVFQVSDGLPGERSSSEDYYTFDEAQAAFDKMCKERRPI